jgi:hypothetical protein
VSRHARFEVVGANGRIVFVSENYKQKASAVRAIDTLARFLSPTGQAWVSNLRVGNERTVDIRYGSDGHDTWHTAHRLEVRDVDERGRS